MQGRISLPIRQSILWWFTKKSYHFDSCKIWPQKWLQMKLKITQSNMTCSVFSVKLCHWQVNIWLSKSSRILSLTPILDSLILHRILQELQILTKISLWESMQNHTFKDKISPIILQKSRHQDKRKYVKKRCVARRKKENKSDTRPCPQLRQGKNEIIINGGKEIYGEREG